MRGYDYYELLGVSRTASPTEIRSAYRSLAKVMHPDTGGTAGTFRMLREAYETLTDPERRHDYDTGDTGDTDEDYEDGFDEPTARTGRRADTDHVPVLPRIAQDTIPWWNEVRGGERVALVPSARPARVVLLAAAGGWTLLLLVLVLAAVPGPVLAGWVLVLAGAGGVVARHLLAARREDRAFEAEFGSRAVFGSPGTEPDEIAERLTGDLLARYLTRIPAVRVFHGLAAEAGSVFADIHHAVLCGRRLVLVESKLWLPGHYHVDDAGVLWRNGHRFRGGASTLPDRLDAYRALLPDLEVRGVLLLYPSRAGAITVGDERADAAPMDPTRFVREIGGWLAADPSTVDREAFRTVAGQVVSS